jgi:ABC-type microcin C transport system duplicated ATPase subunit YejF
VGAQVLLLQELQSEFRLTYIFFISHSLLVVAPVATRIAVMRAGQFEVGFAGQVLHAPVDAYTPEYFAPKILPLLWEQALPYKFRPIRLESAH